MQKNAKKLIIVESPAKAKTIGKIVGPEFMVKASVGHVRDLPAHSMGIRITDDDTRFEPVYVVSDDKKGVVAELAKNARDAEEIYLASDPDREGEAIAWHLKEILDESAGKTGQKKKFLRVQYNEITPSAVRRAFEHPSDINQHLVDAQQARRILDRLVGYKVSFSLWKQVGKGLSAGRVQSVGLRLVCEREAEIQAFKPVPYWVFAATLRKQGAPKTPFEVKLRQINGVKADVADDKLAAAVESALAASDFSLSDLSTTQKARRPYAPFITSTLQQAASNFLGYTPSVTMSIAQNLYEGIELSGSGPVGLITYMRTDSFSVSEEAASASAKFIVDTYGEEYHQKEPRSFKNKKSAQGAHEAIRPTDPARTPESLAHKLKPQELKLYDLIWRRFIASRMSDAISSVTTAKVTAVPRGASTGAISEMTLSASSSEIVFQGFMKVTGAIKQTPEDDTQKEGVDDTLESLPPLVVGEKLDLVKSSGERKETKPPARYNEASLVKALEANGIGRPSTYASIIATLLARKYVVKEKRNLAPTDLGRNVNSFLVQNYDALFNVAFTANMETQLDEVEDPAMQLDWQGMLTTFYSKLKKSLHDAKAPDADPETVEAVLAKFDEVKEWAPPSKSGKRVFSDEKFVQDIRNTFLGIAPAKKTSARKGKAAKKEAQLEDAEHAPDLAAQAADEDSAPTGGEVSANQFKALLNILSRYRKQISGFEDFLKSIGQEALLEDEKLQPPRKSTIAIIKLLDKAGPPEGSEKFYGSLSDQVKRGKRLSDKQRHYLERMFLERHEQIEGFSPELCAEVEVEYRIPAQQDTAKIEDVMAGLANVTEWKAPTKKGKRVFDDADFYKSVTTQFSLKKRLSEPQAKVLDRMFLNYRDQIPNAAEIIARHGITPPARKTRKGAE